MEPFHFPIRPRGKWMFWLVENSNGQGFLIFDTELRPMNLFNYSGPRFLNRLWPVNSRARIVPSGLDAHLALFAIVYSTKEA